MVPKCLDYKHSERLVVSEDRVDEHDNEKQCQNDGIIAVVCGG